MLCMHSFTYQSTNYAHGLRATPAVALFPQQALYFFFVKGQVVLLPTACPASGHGWPLRVTASFGTSTPEGHPTQTITDAKGVRTHHVVHVTIVLMITYLPCFTLS